MSGILNRTSNEEVAFSTLVTPYVHFKRFNLNIYDPLRHKHWQFLVCILLITRYLKLDNALTQLDNALKMQLRSQWLTISCVVFSNSSNVL